MDHNKIETARINEIVERVNNMSAIIKVMMYQNALAWLEHQGQLREIADLFTEQYYRVIEITKIKNDMYVVEYEAKSIKTKYYKPVVKMDFLSESFCDFDSALLAALSLEKTGRAEAGYWAGKLLKIGGV